MVERGREFPFVLGDADDVLEWKGLGETVTVIYRWELSRIGDHFLQPVRLAPEHAIWLWALCRTAGNHARSHHPLIDGDRCPEPLRSIAAQVALLGDDARASIPLRRVILDEWNRALLDAQFPVQEWLRDPEGRVVLGEAPGADSTPEAWNTVAQVSLDEVELWNLLRFGSRQLPRAWPGVGQGAGATVETLIESLRGRDDGGGEEQRWLGELSHYLRGIAFVPAGPHRGLSQDGRIDGVQGLSHRGELPRLLSSELAHDDEMLAHRIALHEALYLQREPPRIPTQRARVLLLDAGVRLWGWQRFFLTSVALAHWANSEQDHPVEGYRCCGGKRIAVDFTDSTSLREHLAGVYLERHPAAAVRDWLHEYMQSGNSRVDLLLLTSAQTLQDPEFTSELVELDRTLSDSAVSLYLGTVARSGVHELYSWSGRSAHRLYRAQIPESLKSGLRRA